MRPPWDFLFFALAAVVATAAVARFSELAGATRAAFAVLAALVGIGWFYVDSEGRREARVIERLVAAMAPTYAHELERLGHSDLPLDVAADDPHYLSLIEAEKRWLTANPEIADIYTFRESPNGDFILFVDSETDYDKNGRFEGARELRTAIGEVYPLRSPAMIAAFGGKSGFEAHGNTDRWGSWVTNLVPMRDAAGRVEAVLGVDFEARLFVDAVERGRLRALAVLGALLAVVLTGFASVARLRRSADELAARNRETALARDAALAASQSKSRFLASVSHELRTPLHVFLGMNELLLDSRLDERQRKFADTARRAAEGLLGMVDDLLDYAQLEGGRLASDPFVFDFAELVSAAAETHRPAAEAKGLALGLEIEPSARVRILSDPRRIRQILRHLLANAIKFTDRGSVTLFAAVGELAGAPAGPAAEGIAERQAMIAVADTGIGVDPERRAEIFDRFSQADPSSTRRHGGTGIGLALSKALTDRLGGTLELESETGRGSTFRLRFPVRELVATEGGE